MYLWAAAKEPEKVFILCIGGATLPQILASSGDYSSDTYRRIHSMPQVAGKVPLLERKEHSP